MRRVFALTLCAVLAPATLLVRGFVPCAQAQWSAQLDVGGAARREVPSEPTAWPARFGAALAYDTRFGTVSGRGEAFSGFRRAERSDVLLDATFLSAPVPRTPALRFLVGGASAGTRLAEGVRRDRAEVAGGAAVRIAGVDARASVSKAWFETGAVTPDAHRAEVELRRGFSRGSLGIVGRAVRYPDQFVSVRETTYVVAGFPYRGTVERLESTQRRYGEVEGGFAWWMRGVRVESRAGVRLDAAGIGPERWARALLEVPLLRQVAIVGEVGHRMSSPEQRLPAYRFTSVYLRLRGGGVHDAASPAAAREAVERELGSTEVDRTGALIVRGIAGRKVEMTGDFSDWRPVELSRVAQRAWRYGGPLAPGIYHVMLRIDGGSWQPPPGLPAVAGEFAESVGVLLVNP